MEQDLPNVGTLNTRGWSTAQVAQCEKQPGNRRDQTSSDIIFATSTAGRLVGLWRGWSLCVISVFSGEWNLMVEVVGAFFPSFLLFKLIWSCLPLFQQLYTALNGGKLLKLRRKEFLMKDRRYLIHGRTKLKSQRDEKIHFFNKLFFTSIRNKQYSLHSYLHLF